MTTPAVYDNSVRIGYARVSTRTQDHQAQLDALAAAHCRQVVVETASTRGERPKLLAAMDMLKPGDTLVIYKPDRVALEVLGRICFVTSARPTRRRSPSYRPLGP